MGDDIEIKTENELPKFNSRKNNELPNIITQNLTIFLMGFTENSHFVTSRNVSFPFLPKPTDYMFF